MDETDLTKDVRDAVRVDAAVGNHVDVVVGVGVGGVVGGGAGFDVREAIEDEWRAYVEG